MDDQNPYFFKSMLEWVNATKVAFLPPCPDENCDAKAACISSESIISVDMTSTKCQYFVFICRVTRDGPEAEAQRTEQR